ncbi:DNA repair and recombination protein RAD54B-like, partial [Chrysoperla carnea]|uniref:DNA repair and recombination protein RAD54B-like n=1 Tax=Chrysoperla carnea TaxID=189513 RepID=UPI001D07500B
MRRSAAPSKRNNFIPPIATLAGNSKTFKSINETRTNTSNTIEQTFENAARSTTTLLNLLEETESNDIKNSRNDQTIENKNNFTEIVNNSENSSIYNVVYGKKSGKKHKTWSGDGILEVINKSAVLKDLDGKILGRVANLKNVVLEDGTILSVGNNEVQIIELCTKRPKIETKITENSTKRKSGTLSPKNVESLHRQHRTDQILSRCIKKRKILETSKTERPMDALVMPCPPVEHQWLYNTSKKKLCEVIVDPELTRVLRPHQRQGVTFLYKCILGFYNKKNEPKCMGAILADEMGLGKTLQCITLIWTILKQGPYGGEPIIRRILIVTPSSLVKNWQNEFEKWLGKYKIRTFIVDAKNRPKDYVRMEYIPVVIISYEMLIRHFDDLTNIKFDLVICDEGHRLKNGSIKAATMLSSLACERRILLTGTPIQNDLQEFYTLVNFINPNYLGTHFEYRQYYEDPITWSRNPEIDEETKVLGEMRAIELNEKTKHFILRRTQEINNKYLPTKHELIVFCSMSDLQKRMCQTLIEYWESREIYNSVKISHLQIIILLKKICNHPSLINNNKRMNDSDSDSNSDSNQLTESLIGHLNEYLIRNQYDNNININIEQSSKFKVVDCILKTLSTTNKERVVLVSYSTQTLDMFADYCTRKNYKYCRLDGSTSVQQRAGIVQDFNKTNSNIFVFLLSARAGGVGLNLTGASRLILYDSDWNPATDLQAMSRIWRDGQSNQNVFIYRLITTGSVEEKIFQRQIFKTGLSGAVVDPSNTTNGIKLSHDDLKDLFQLNFESNCLTHDLLNCACRCDGVVQLKNDLKKQTMNMDEIRECQLGVGGDGSNDSRTESNLKMNELDLWEHYGPPFNNHLFMELALSSVNCISFIFRN